MNRKTAITVALAAVALVGAAALLSKSRDMTPARARGSAMLPGLEARAGDVGAVEVLRGNATVRLERGANGSWALAGNDGYPARGELVRAMLVSVAGLTVDDRMTAKRDRHSELGLAWPDAGGKARLVRFLSARPGESPVAEIVLGEERFAPDAVFARLPAEDQTWRTLGRVQVPSDALAWIDRSMVSLPVGETTKVAFDGITVALPPTGAEPTPDAPRPAWSAEVAGDERANWSEAQVESARLGLPSYLERLEFDGVRKARPDAAKDPKWTLEFETKSASVSVLGHEESDGVWFTMSALPRPGFAAPPAPKYDGDPHVPDWAKLDAAWQGWEFKLPQWKADTLRRMRAKPETAAEAGAAADAPPG